MTFADKVRKAHAKHPELMDMNKRLKNIAHLCKTGKYKIHYSNGKLIVERFAFDNWYYAAEEVKYINPNCYDYYISDWID
jgi:hypothetical protein